MPQEIEERGFEKSGRAISFATADPQSSPHPQRTSAEPHRKERGGARIHWHDRQSLPTEPLTPTNVRHRQQAPESAETHRHSEARDRSCNDRIPPLQPPPSPPPPHSPKCLSQKEIRSARIASSPPHAATTPRLDQSGSGLPKSVRLNHRKTPDARPMQDQARSMASEFQSLRPQMPDLQIAAPQPLRPFPQSQPPEK